MTLRGTIPFLTFINGLCFKKVIRKKNIVLLSEECLLGSLYPSLIIYVISVLFCYAFMHVCLLVPCGHLLGKG